jgi:hypothetical protein
MQVFFTTEENPNWSETMSKVVPAISGNTEEYYVLFNSNELWKGKVTALRIDPVSESGQPFTLKSAEFVKAPYLPPRKMIINGLECTTNFYPEKSVTGDTLVAFDPDIGLDFRLNTFHEWSKDKGELVLNFPNHVVKFTVGSDRYTVDGVEKSLGYPINMIDGLPLLPMNKICEEVGYTMWENEEGIICIETDQKPYFDLISAREFGKWEFEFPGDTENWSSSFMSLRVMDGYASNHFISIPVKLLAGDAVAAGQLEMLYNENLEVVGFDTGLLMPTMSYNDNKAGKVKIVGMIEGTENVKADQEIFANVWFKVKEGKTVSGSLKFELKNLQFCNWNEEFVTNLKISDVQY